MKQYSHTRIYGHSYPGLRHAIWLEANKRYKLVRKLGAGSDREAWLTKDDLVFKMPKKPYSVHLYGPQNERELGFIKRNSHKPWVPQCEGIYIFGVLCLLMERVYPGDEWYGEKWLNILPHGSAFFDALQVKSEYISDGCQGGFNKNGVLKVYDLGIQ